MKKKVLIIDADLQLLNTLEDELIQAGYDVIKATSGQNGLQLVQTADLIVVAVEMPDINGFVICSTIKKDTNSQYIPVIITSSASDTTAFENHLNLATHADGYFLKPLDIPALIEEITAIFADQEAACAGEEMVEMEEQPAENDGDDSEVIKALSLDDMSLFEDIDASTLEDSSETQFLDEQPLEIVPEPEPAPAPIPKPVVPSIPGKSVGLPPKSPLGKLPTAPKPLLTPKTSPAHGTAVTPSAIQPKTPSGGIPKIAAGAAKPSFPQPAGLSGSRVSSESKPTISRTVSASFTAVSQTAIPNAEISRLNDEITVLNNEIAALKSEITARDNRITMLQSQCEALTSRCQNAESIAETLKNETAQMGAQFDEIAQNDAAKNEQLEAFVAADAEKTEQINMLIQSNNEKNQQLEAIAQQILALIQQ